MHVLLNCHIIISHQSVCDNLSCMAVLSVFLVSCISVNDTLYEPFKFRPCSNREDLDNPPDSLGYLTITGEDKSAHKANVSATLDSLSG